MKRISLFARLALVLTLILGLLIWLTTLPAVSNMLSDTIQSAIRNIHLLSGILGTTGLLILALFAIFRNRVRILGILGVLYALAMPALGVLQVWLLLNSFHWLIQLVHLLVGIGAMVLIRRLEKQLTSKA